MEINKEEAEEFYKQVYLLQRVYSKKNYLWPIKDDEIRNNPKLIQIMVGKNTTTMKYAILFILLLGIVATACKDEMFTGQTPVDGVAPLQIKNPEVINVEGGALITYDLPMRKIFCM